MNHSAAFPPRAFSSFPAIPHVVRTKGSLIIDRLGAPLPTERCFKCNCGAEYEVRKTFASTGGYLRFLVILQPLLIPILLPFFLRRQERVSLAFGLCASCRERRNFELMLGAIFLFGSVPLFTFGVLTITTVGPLLGFAGASLLAAGLIIMVRSHHLADPKYVDGRWVVLTGGGPPFLRAIPDAGELW